MGQARKRGTKAERAATPKGNGYKAPVARISGEVDASGRRLYRVLRSRGSIPKRHRAKMKRVMRKRLGLTREELSALLKDYNDG